MTRAGRIETLIPYPELVTNSALSRCSATTANFWSAGKLLIEVDTDLSEVSLIESYFPDTVLIGYQRLLAAKKGGSKT